MGAWALGRAHRLVAKRRQDGVPLEQTPFGRRSVSSERVPSFADLSYAPAARRFDMGERDHFVGLVMAWPRWGRCCRSGASVRRTSCAPPSRAGCRPDSWTGSRRRAPMPRHVSAGCASARMPTTTRRMWNASSRPSRGRCGGRPGLALSGGGRRARLPREPTRQSPRSRLMRSQAALISATFVVARLTNSSGTPREARLSGWFSRIRRFQAARTSSLLACRVRPRTG